MDISKLKSTVNNIRTSMHVYKQWQQLTHLVMISKPASPHLIIIPCDPWSVGGSRGDEAMLTAVIHQYRNKYPHIPIEIIAEGDMGIQYIANLHFDGVTHRMYWSGAYPLARIYKQCMHHNPSHVVVLGADCMDGYYAPSLSMMLLALHDLFSRSEGVESRMMGFSFNTHPSIMMKWAFRHISPDTKLNLRDAVSLERFKHACKVNAGLVADSAFMLQPDYNFDGYRELEQWVNERKKQGTKHVIGMNFHPMLRKYDGAEDIKQDALILARNVEHILNENSSLDFVFIPHDDRSRLTDNLMLGTMAEYICQQGLGSRVYYKEEVYRAPQLKAFCLLLDGLVSSRMHLAIAALGQGKSVLAASYQGKFEGLFQHFSLPQQYILPASTFISEAMVKSFNDYISHLDELNTQVQRALPHVTNLSEQNLL